MNARIRLPTLNEVEIEISKRACERSLLEFVRQAWHVIEDVPYIHGWHVEVICQHLEAVTRGKIRKLLINIPPRMSKSTLVSILWPAWEWTSKPSQKYMVSSYSGDLSTGYNTLCRKLLESEWYQSRWGNTVKMDRSQNQKTRYENTRGGYRIATSTGGTVTGLGGSRLICLHPDTQIQCEDALIPISILVERRMGVLVAAFNHQTNSQGLYRIERHEKSPGRPCLRVRTEFGRELILTTDHPVFVYGKQQYIPAEELKPGDALLPYMQPHFPNQAVARSQKEDMRAEVCSRVMPAHSEYRNLYGLPENIQSHSGACSAQSELLLQSGMFREGRRRGQKSPVDWRQSLHSMQRVPSAGKPQKGRGQSKEFLLQGVPVGWLQAKAAKVLRVATQALCGMWSHNLWGASSHEDAGNVLQKMWRDVAQPAYERFWQWKVCAWAVVRTVSEGIQAYRGLNSGEGWSGLSLVRNGGSGPQSEWPITSPARAPYRLQQGQQRSDQSDNAMPVLSRHDAQPLSNRSTQLATDVVCSVEPWGTPEYVYNIAVADVHNYFAEGVLVHNCDDPHSTREAASDQIRGEDVTWFRSSWLNRLNDAKQDAHVVVMQRQHTQDVSGWIIEAKGWEHVCLPMEYDGVRRKTCLGAYDRRTKIGELLIPERFGPVELANAKIEYGEYGAAAQLQQQPAPPGGGILKSKFMRLWPHDEPLPIPRMIFQSYDTGQSDETKEGAKKKTDTDPTACGVYMLFDRIWQTKKGEAKTTSSLMLIDAWDEKLEYPDLLKRVNRDWRAKYGDGKSGIAQKRADLMLIEKKSSGIALCQELIRDGNCKVQPVDPGKLSKEARARLVSPLLEAGLVWVLESAVNEDTPATWSKPMFTQMDLFPKAPHDDHVDQFVQVLDYCHRMGYIEIPRADYKEEDWEPNRYQDKTPMVNHYYA